jgi:hypothetical protein
LGADVPIIARAKSAPEDARSAHETARDEIRSITESIAPTAGILRTIVRRCTCRGRAAHE